MTSRGSEVLRYCTSNGVPQRSLIVALVVGSILNAINQGDTIVRGGHIHIAKMVLTFAVPYCVATYGAVSYRMTASRERVGPAAADAGPPSTSA